MLWGTITKRRKCVLLSNLQNMERQAYNIPIVSVYLEIIHKFTF